MGVSEGSEQEWTYQATHMCHPYRIAGNFRGRKLLQISRFCSNLWNFSLRNWGPGMASFDGNTSEQSTKVFSTKVLFPPTCENFLPWKFPTICCVWVYLGAQNKSEGTRQHTCTTHILVVVGRATVIHTKYWMCSWLNNTQPISRWLTIFHIHTYRKSIGMILTYFTSSSYSWRTGSRCIFETITVA